MSVAEDPILTDYRNDVRQLLLVRGLDDRISENDELALAACWDRGQLASVCATRIAAARRQQEVVT